MLRHNHFFYGELSTLQLFLVIPRSFDPAVPDNIKVAGVSGVSGERGKDGSEKGIEVKEPHPDFGCVTRFAEWFCVRPSFLFSPSPLPHRKA